MWRKAAVLKAVVAGAVLGLLVLQPVGASAESSVVSLSGAVEVLSVDGTAVRLPDVDVVVSAVSGGVPPVAVSTGGDGTFTVVDVQAGDYLVSLPSVPAGLQPAFEFDGVRVTVDSDGGDADVVLTANGVLDGFVSDPEFWSAAPGADVRCVWFGVDGVRGTADDAVWLTSASASGEFSLGVPFGSFSCSGSFEGRRLDEVSSDVRSGERATVSLLVVDDGRRLPPTGGVLLAVGVGMLMVAAGWALRCASSSDR